jgi:hypothetical protein
MDAAIIDPCDRGLMARILAAVALGGRDPHCMGYLRAFRSGKLETPPPFSPFHTKNHAGLGPSSQIVAGPT